MIRTQVGYAGGSTLSPTYHQMGDHSETVQVEFDREKISFSKLLDIFWSIHSPFREIYSPQYRSIIFYHTAGQKEAAAKSKRSQESLIGRKIFTEIRPFTGFFAAEAYHQKFYLQNTPGVMEIFSEIYPDPLEFAASTAAARLNGLMANGSVRARWHSDEQLRADFFRGRIARL